MTIKKNKVAIILLAYADFESLEISLANFSKSLDDSMHFFYITEWSWCL